jgi:hypothetical protein
MPREGRASSRKKVEWNCCLFATMSAKVQSDVANPVNP